MNDDLENLENDESDLEASEASVLSGDTAPIDEPFGYFGSTDIVTPRVDSGPGYIFVLAPDDNLE